MPKSTRSFLFPDINVWIALSYERHVHHQAARGWLAQNRSARLFFCRFTQLGLLRLLTSPAVMADEVCTQRQAWQIFDTWLRHEQVGFAEEAAGLDEYFRRLSLSGRVANKDWADSYLAAFAMAAGLTVVTFDHDFRGKLPEIVLLRG
jgi:toxin-antitoxin system PIN domain toxin